jgi:hypothetical protein
MAMCKILLTGVLLLSFSFIATAQFNKGDVLLGGQLSYNSTKNEYISSLKANNGNFTVSIGQAVKVNAVFGITLSYSPGSQKNNDPNNFYDNTINGYSAGIFYRLYRSLGKEFYFFGEGGANYTGSTSASINMAGVKISSGTSNGGNIYIMPGVAYRISKKFFLEVNIPNLFSVAYLNQKTMSNGISETSDSFGTSASFTSNPLSNIGIGFRLVL